MENFRFQFITFLLISMVFACNNKSTKNNKKQTFSISSKASITNSTTLDSLINHPPDGMVWIKGGTFLQGAVPQDKMAMDHEKPQHSVAVDGFFMDISEVTNSEFSKFVLETGYVTVAERPIDWEEMKKQLPQDTPKPNDSILQPGSLLFKKAKATVPNLYDFSQWWAWSIGVNWRHPLGPKSNLEGRENYPVVHVAFEDTKAYCKWANRRLPTEAEWEYAARGNKTNATYFWGDDLSQLSKMANTWEGEFPVMNTLKDGFERMAPVKSYPPNTFGLYDMTGNVWEFTTDWYNTRYYKEITALHKTIKNPKGAERAYDPNNSYLQQRVIKGGSFLCSDVYCASYRVSSRMGNSVDSSAEHLGFRTVATPNMLLKK
ncbi:formylglycine-generating enzyme family protein [Cellulophaga sp. Hel_I_12]|uniref:formylglycine-generating enzyme family protein n=1 Tax=Cellulophaga sp. Hel_I_12 TaxID=1249972 RepID=UPI000645CE82|nr:formylglycine-generating enzyme family protein [Cellulophaga sp. Hel_I_12]